jgi:hypothetical protein
MRLLHIHQEDQPWMLLRRQEEGREKESSAFLTSNFLANFIRAEKP